MHHQGQQDNNFQKVQLQQLNTNVDIKLHSQNRQPPNQELSTMMQQLRSQIQEL